MNSSLVKVLLIDRDPERRKEAHLGSEETRI